MEVYLVIEYDKGLIYIPFKNIECVDYFTVAYDNLLDLASSINKILDINVDNKEIMDVYLVDDISKIDNDMQEYNKRYLAVKYSNNNFIKEDIVNKFGNYLCENIKRIDKHVGLHQVFINYINKYHKEGKITKEDIYKIAKLYLGDNYIRYKDFYFRYKDKGYKFRIRENKDKYSKKRMLQIDKDSIMLLTMFTGMNIEELKEYVGIQMKSGYKR